MDCSDVLRSVIVYMAVYCFVHTLLTAMFG